MSKKMHARTMALVLATTTLLQVTGVTSQLLNGVPFEVANAALRTPPLEPAITQSGFEVTNGAGEVMTTTGGSVTIESLICVPEGNVGPSTITATLTFTIEDERMIIATTQASVTYNGDGTATVSATAFSCGDEVYIVTGGFSQAGIPVNIISASTTPASVEIITHPSVLVALMRDENGNEIPTGPGTTYLWYKNNIALMTPDFDEYILTNEDRNSNFKVEVTFNGITTTSSSVTYDWYNESIVDKCGLEADISDANMAYNLTVEGTADGQYQIGSKAIFKRAIDAAQAVVDDVNATQEQVDDAIFALCNAIDAFNQAIITQGSPNPLINYWVKILGSERVGRTLTAEFMVDDVEFDGPVDITYEWYRIDHREDAARINGTLVGRNKTYSLVSSDLDKYIRVFVYYNGKQVAEEDTGRIDRVSSRGSSSSGSSSSSSSNSSSNGTGTTTNTTGTAAVTFTAGSNGTMQLVNSNGQPAVGWQQINGIWYFANPAGIVQTGWQQVNGTWYLLNNNGSMATGWQQTADGTWYLLKDSGSMATGWQKVNGTWYLLKDNGAMATGWQKTNGKWYYLYSNGSMASNTVIDGYRVDASGAWV